MEAVTQEAKSGGITQGDFVWYELMTSDADAAKAFYSVVVGWNAQDSGMPGQQYTILTAGETRVGGIFTLPKEASAAGAKPAWAGYIVVDDVDRFAERVQEAGGTVHRRPEDIPSVGRFSIVADPQGATFVLFKGNSEAPPSRLPAGAPGTIGWHELYAAEWKSAFAFYSELFGWRKSEAHDMGAMGTYQTFSTDDKPMNGGMMTNPEGGAPFWLFYFTVDDIQAAVTRVKSEGGQLKHGPMQVPGGSWIAQCHDPQGALFALTSAK